MQRAERTWARDRAAAGSDLDEFDRRDLYRQPAAAPKPLLARRFEPPRNQRLAVIN
jgi:hypothetical protein